MGDDIGLGLSSMSVCFDFPSTNVVQLSNRKPYFYQFRYHHPLITHFLIEIRGLTYLPKSGGGREGQSNPPSVLTALQKELFYGYLIFKPQVFEHLSNQSLGSKVITRNIGLTKKIWLCYFRQCTQLVRRYGHILKSLQLWSFLSESKVTVILQTFDQVQIR